MASLHNDVYDNGLNEIVNATTPVLHLCSQEPTTHTEATSTYTLGNKAAPTVTGPTDGSPNGRSVSISTFTDGTITGTGTGSHWAYVDNNDNRLLAVRAAPSSQAVTSGNDLELTSAIVINLADPS